MGNKIKHILLDKNIKQKALSLYADVSEAYISDVLSDKKIPSLPVLKKIADFLEVSIDELLKE